MIGQGIAMMFRLVVGLGILTLAGCGDLNSTVSGTVTVNDVPIEGGGVTFHPVKEGPSAYGQIGPGGQYTLFTGQKEGLFSGEYIVTVVGTRYIPAKDPNMEPTPQLLTPERYGDRNRTDLKVTVNPGPNVIPLSLRKP